ncbi:type II secretion system protein N [Crenobacter caeni]|uniref:Type II secretion system protein N n=1 Tax=Crenobacter caeni TaxID=2705474 RepID=A0A6B2KT83_9NEIS|nr:type II secretion system protein N [Crenobacter caeni]NDV13358.1 type II secretion system protein N [Crenobacter caeni]
MRRVWQAALVALLLALGALAAWPASWLDVPLSAATGARWRLAGAEGTLWRGSAQPVFVGEDGTVLPASRIGWDWQGAALWQGALAWTLVSDAGEGRLALRPDGWQLERFSAAVPVGALAGLSDTWRAARLGGVLVLDVGRFGRQAGRFDGAATLEWRGASSPLTRIQPFGSYRLAASGAGERIALQLATLAGPLTIDGQGSWQIGQLPDFGGQASSSEADYPALKPLMLMLGLPDGPTSVRWRARATI